MGMGFSGWGQFRWMRILALLGVG
jgi:hypothetical protein